MDNQARIYVEFSSELKAQLNDRIDLETILQETGIDGDVEWHALPPTYPEERSKGLVETVAIAASLAAAAKLLESAITHYLDHKSVRDSHFVYWVNEPALDGKGKPILDKKGKPRIVRRQVSGFDAFPEVPGEGVTVSVSGKGLSVGTGQESPTKPGKVAED